MTIFGKLLVFLNLVIGVGIAVGSTVVYTHRPTWFDPIPDAVDGGNSVLTFKQLQADIDTLTKASATQSKAWGDEYAGVQARERLRDQRRDVLFGPEAKDGKRVGGWLEVARKGDPARKDQAGFYDLKRVPANARGRLDAGLIDTTVKSRGEPIVGPGGDPLKAAETLLERYTTDAKAVTDLLASIEMLRSRQVQLGYEIRATESRILKQIDIRDQQDVERFYLSGYEINWFSQLQTVRAREGQLKRRLTTFVVAPKE